MGHFPREYVESIRTEDISVTGEGSDLRQSHANNSVRSAHRHLHPYVQRINPIQNAEN